MRCATVLWVSVGLEMMKLWLVMLNKLGPWSKNDFVQVAESVLAQLVENRPAAINTKPLNSHRDGRFPLGKAYVWILKHMPCFFIDDVAINIFSAYT